MPVFSRLAKPAIVRRLFARNVPVSRVGTHFHTSNLLAEEGSKSEAKATVAVEDLDAPGFLERNGITDWKLSLPIGAAILIPTLSNGIYVLNEESQLACCFFLFCTSLYKFGGDAIGSYFDEKANAILAEQNAAEDAIIQLMESTIQVHQEQLSAVEDAQAVREAYNETIDIMNTTQLMKSKHENRATVVKNLETIIAYETRHAQELQKRMVTNATNQVRALVEQGSPLLKENALSRAIGLLQGSTDPSSENDEICKMYITYIREFAERNNSEEDPSMTLSVQEQETMQQNYDAFVKELNMGDPALEESSNLEVTTESEDSIV